MGIDFVTGSVIGDCQAALSARGRLVQSYGATKDDRRFPARRPNEQGIVTGVSCGYGFLGHHVHSLAERNTVEQLHAPKCEP